ncbi:MAG: vitamin B12 ABC transporter substrate-binding protein BtuF [Gammaproteobacteria bacterium]|nr:MAG: vitamin B12 ABC transporter substrate-binding protein BtuF [Gammaproteobacteria bacterium]
MSDKGITVRLMLLLVMFCATPVQAAESTPQRIITLSPHLAEIVYLLGAGDQLLGVAEYSDFPHQVKKIQRIGGATGLDIERILSIKPDLILAWQGGTRGSDIANLKKLGLPVVGIKSESLEDIPDSLNILGKLLHRQQQASTLIGNFNEHLQQISKKYKSQSSHRVFIEISSQPLMGLTNRHPFGAGLALCGLKNIFADINKAAINTDLESILSRNVEYVLLRQSVTGNDYAARKGFYQINDDSALAFVSFDEDTAFRQTPRLLDAVEQVCRNVYGS